MISAAVCSVEKWTSAECRKLGGLKSEEVQEWILAPLTLERFYTFTFEHLDAVGLSTL
jgi:hypothetical protein